MNFGKKLRTVFSAVAGGALLGCGPVNVYRQADTVYMPAPQPPVVERAPEPVYVEPVQPRSLYYSSTLDCYVDPYTSNVRCYDVVFPRYAATTPPLWLDFNGYDDCYYPRGYGRGNSLWIGVIDSPRLGLSWGLALGDVLIFSSHGRHRGAYYNYHHRRDRRDRREYRNDHRRRDHYDRHDRHDRRDRDRDHDRRRDNDHRDSHRSRDDRPRQENDGNRGRQYSPPPQPKPQPQPQWQQQEQRRRPPAKPRQMERTPRQTLPDLEKPRQRQRQNPARSFQGSAKRAPREAAPQQRRMQRSEGQRRNGGEARQNGVNRRSLPRHERR